MSSRRTRSQSRAQGGGRNQDQHQHGAEAKDPAASSVVIGMIGGRGSKRKLTEGDLEAKGGNGSQEISKRRKKQNQTPQPNPLQPASTSSAGQESSNTQVTTDAISAALRTMQNKLVLDIVAKKLPTAKLFNLRQTCVSWNQSFVPELRKSYNRPINLYNLPDKYWGERSMKDYTNMIEPSHEIPFTLYAIFDSSEARHRDFRDFFSSCGKSIRHLWLDSHSAWEKGVNMDKMRQIIFELTPELNTLTLRTDMDEATPIWNKRQKKKLTKIIPNLRRLNLGTLGDIPAEYKELFVDVFKCAVCLTHLSMEEGHNESNLEIISFVRDSMPHLQNLKSLHLFELRAPELRVLVEMARRKENPLRLQDFRTSILYRSEDHEEVANLFHTFLGSQAGALRTLEIEMDGFTFQDNGAERRPIHIPKMNGLHAFGLRRHGLKRFVLEYDEGTLANNFPKLKGFSYNFFNYGLWSRRTDGEIVTEDMNRMVHDELTGLVLDVAFDKTTLARLGSLLPSITRLQLELTSTNMNTLPTVFKMWPALISFEVHYKQDSYKQLELDEFLSGIPKSKHKLVNRQLESTPPTLDSIRTMLRKYKTKPGFSDLYQLKRFTLTLNDYAYKITDIGGYFGLAMASSEMQHLIIERSERPKAERQTWHKNLISTHCQDLIRSAFAPFAVIEIN